MDITPNIKMALLELRTNLRLIREIKTLSGNPVTADQELLFRLKETLEALKVEIGSI